MSVQTDLLFLHGINDSQDKPWDVTLAAMLGQAGFPDNLAGVRLLVPSYLSQLDGKDLSSSSPARTYSAPAEGSATDLRLRAKYRVQHASLAQQLRHAVDRQVNPGMINKPRPTAEKIALKMKVAKQAGNYASRPEVRNSVLATVLDSINESRSLVILAHSLGTLVALDLIRYLPKGTSARLLVTVASPLGADPLFQEQLFDGRRSYQFPYGVVDSWINVFNPLDYVAGGAGLRTLCPESLDVVRNVGFGEHGLAPQLDDEDFGGVIGRALYDPPARKPAGRGKVTKLPDEVVFPLLMQHFGQCQSAALRDAGGRRSSDRSRRLTEAVHLQGQRLEDKWRDDPELLKVARLLGEDATGPLAAALARPDAPVADAALLMALTNPIEPFEIEIPRKVEVAAQRAYLASVGLTTLTLEDVEKALERARDPFKTFREHIPRPVWYGLGAVGAAAAVAAPILLFAGVAGASAAGAAAITGALAAFGPGGMIGGLLTLTLAVGGGTATSAIGLGSAIARSSPEAFKQSATELIARAILSRQLLVPAAGRTEWVILTQALAQAESDLYFVRGISDPRAQSVRALNTKIRMAKAALASLKDLGFGAAEDPPS